MHERKWLVHFSDCEWEIAQPIPNFWYWKRKWKIQFLTFGIGNRKDKSNSKILLLGMGIQNSVPNPTLERIYKRVSGKCWEREVPLMPSPLVADPPNWTPLLGKKESISDSPLDIYGWTPYNSCLFKVNLILKT